MDDPDRNAGCCLCLIKYCAKRQSFSARMEMGSLCYEELNLGV